ncbi:MAG: hypothetical protein LBH16_09885 [Treponema sp.]|jgi:hypothetical protein|nr:hypothetical protein [Treponema sp.]
MKYDARYFYQIPFVGTNNSLKRYELCEHIGIEISGFSPEWISLHVTHSRSGIKHHLFKDMQGLEPFKYALLLGGSMYIGLKNIPEMSTFLYGYFGNDAVLMRLKKTTVITLWFFEDRKLQVEMLYDQWISCQLELD